MCLIFLLSLPLLNPWVRGDGVGYYPFVRAPLIEQRLDFIQHYQYANPQFSRSAQHREVPRPDYFQHKIGRIEGRKVATASAD